MKKTLIALAAVAAATGAMAQATISGQIAGGVSKVGTAAQTIGFQDTNLTFRASEDLGGGLRASGAFTIEGMNSRGITNNVTTAGAASTSHGARTNGPTNADSSLSLAGGFGTITLANTRSGDQAVAANVMSISLPGNQYNTSNHNVFGTRPNVQLLAYTSPELIPGLRVNVGQAAITDNQAAKINIVGATYAQGPLSVGFVQKTRNADAVAIISGSEKTTSEFSATYNFGVAVVGVGHSTKALTTGKAATTYGVRVPMGAFTFGLNAGKRDKAQYQDIGVTYALSKRTSVSYATGNYKTNAAATKTTQSRLRLEHNF